MMSAPTGLTPADNTVDLKDDVLQFYKDSGLEPMAKEASVINICHLILNCMLAFRSDIYLMVCARNNKHLRY